MNSYSSQGDGDYVLSAMGRPARNKSEKLEGGGPEKLSTAPNMWGRGFREAKPLMSHEVGSGMDEPLEAGFRWRGKSSRI